MDARTEGPLPAGPSEKRERAIVIDRSAVAALLLAGGRLDGTRSTSLVLEAQTKRARRRTKAEGQTFVLCGVGTAGPRRRGCRDVVDSRRRDAGRCLETEGRRRGY